MKRSYKLFKICLWKSQHIFFAKSLCYVKLPDISSKNANSLVCFWTALKNKRDLEITSTYEHSHTEATQNRQRKHNTGSNCGEQKTNKTQFNPVRPSFSSQARKLNLLSFVFEWRVIFTRRRKLRNSISQAPDTIAPILRS